MVKQREGERKGEQNGDQLHSARREGQGRPQAMLLPIMPPRVAILSGRQ
jgi:hypothetical protein